MSPLICYFILKSWYFVLSSKRIAAAFKPRVCGTAGTPDLPVAGPSSWFHYRNIDIQISANQQPTSNSIELFLSHFAGAEAKYFPLESSNAKQDGATGVGPSRIPHLPTFLRIFLSNFCFSRRIWLECCQMSRRLIAGPCHGTLEPETYVYIGIHTYIHVQERKDSCSSAKMKRCCRVAEHCLVRKIGIDER